MSDKKDIIEEDDDIYVLDGVRPKRDIETGELEFPGDERFDDLPEVRYHQ